MFYIFINLNEEVKKGPTRLGDAGCPLLLTRQDGGQLLLSRDVVVCVPQNLVAWKALAIVSTAASLPSSLEI